MSGGSSDSVFDWLGDWTRDEHGEFRIMCITDIKCLKFGAEANEDEKVNGKVKERNENLKKVAKTSRFIEFEQEEWFRMIFVWLLNFGFLF